LVNILGAVEVEGVNLVVGVVTKAATPVCGSVVWLERSWSIQVELL